MRIKFYPWDFWRFTFAEFMKSNYVHRNWIEPREVLSIYLFTYKLTFLQVLNDNGYTCSNACNFNLQTCNLVYLISDSCQECRHVLNKNPTFNFWNIIIWIKKKIMNYLSTRLFHVVTWSCSNDYIFMHEGHVLKPSDKSWLRNKQDLKFS